MLRYWICNWIHRVTVSWGWSIWKGSRGVRIWKSWWCCWLWKKTTRNLILKRSRWFSAWLIWVTRTKITVSVSSWPNLLSFLWRSLCSCGCETGCKCLGVSFADLKPHSGEKALVLGVFRCGVVWVVAMLFQCPSTMPASVKGLQGISVHNSLQALWTLRENYYQNYYYLPRQR